MLELCKFEAQICHFSLAWGIQASKLNTGSAAPPVPWKSTYVVPLPKLSMSNLPLLSSQAVVSSRLQSLESKRRLSENNTPRKIRVAIVSAERPFLLSTLGTGESDNTLANGGFQPGGIRRAEKRRVRGAVRSPTDPSEPANASTQVVMDTQLCLSEAMVWRLWPLTRGKANLHEITQSCTRKGSRGCVEFCETFTQDLLDCPTAPRRKCNSPALF